MNPLRPARAALAGCLLALLLPVPAEASRRPAKPTHARRKAKPHVLETKAPVLPIYGPFLPAEPYLYPQLPCGQTDEPEVVLEARVHEEGPASREGQVEPAEAVAEARPGPSAAARAEAAIYGAARQVGSFLRPKTSSARIKPEDVDLSDLLSAKLLIPVEGADVEKLRDSFLNKRGRYRKHLAIDIGAPRGTPVVATADGEIVKTPREKRGGRTIYLKDRSGQYLFYYAHLKQLAPGIASGSKVSKGDVIGYVGSTGHVIGGPHLHFSIARVPDDEDTQREGLAINPYLLFLASVP